MNSARDNPGATGSLSARASQPCILILGYGNPLRGDDALGVVAAQRLAELIGDPSVQVMTSHQLLPEYAEPISRAELVIFIDIRCDRPPGELSCEELVPAAAVSRSITHYFDPPALLAFSQRVFGGNPKAYALAIGGECFGCEERLSPAVQAAFPALIARAQELVAAWLGGMGKLVCPCPPFRESPHA